MQEKNRKNSDAARDFGQRLGWAIDQLETKQRAVCRACGVRPDVISRLVLGKNRAIKLDLLVALVHFFRERGISVDWLLTGQGSLYGADKRAKEMDRLLSADQDALTVEYLANLTNSHLIQDLIRTVDDPGARAALVRAMRLTPPEAPPERGTD